MNTPNTMQSANIGAHTLPIFFGLQNEAFERMQKLTQLNLATVKAIVGEGQAAFAAPSAGPSLFANAPGLSQQFVEHTLAYAEHVRQIDSQFISAVAEAGTELRSQFDGIWKQWATSFGQGTPFDPSAAVAAMQSALGGMMRPQGIAQQSLKSAAVADNVAADIA
jgi:hypothetical protein